MVNTHAHKQVGVKLAYKLGTHYIILVSRSQLGILNAES